MNRTNLKEDDVGVGLGESEEREREDGGGAAVEDRRAHRHQGLRGALRLGALFKNFGTLSAIPCCMCLLLPP